MGLATISPMFIVELVEHLLKNKGRATVSPLFKMELVEHLLKEKGSSHCLPHVNNGTCGTLKQRIGVLPPSLPCL